MRATAGESAAPTTSAATSIGTMRRGRAAILEGESNRLHAFDHLHRQLRGSKWPPRSVDRIVVGVNVLKGVLNLRGERGHVDDARGRRAVRYGSCRLGGPSDLIPALGVLGCIGRHRDVPEELVRR